MVEENHVSAPAELAPCRPEKRFNIPALAGINQVQAIPTPVGGNRAASQNPEAPPNEGIYHGNAQSPTATTNRPRSTWNQPSPRPAKFSRRPRHAGITPSKSRAPARRNISRNRRASRQAGTPHPPRPPDGGTHNQCLVPAHAGINNPHRRQCPSARAHGDQPSPPEPVYTKSNPVPAPAGINPRVCIGNSISPRRGDQPGSTQ